MPASHRPEPDTLPAVRAAHAAREVAGDDAARGDDARRDAFSALLYGMAVGFASRDADGDVGGDREHAGANDADAADTPDVPLAERVDALATTLLRQALGLAFRDACRSVEAVADALAEGEPDLALLGLVQAGAAAAGDWIDGDRGAFAARILQATAGESFASERALRPRRPT